MTAPWSSQPITGAQHDAWMAQEQERPVGDWIDVVLSLDETVQRYIHPDFLRDRKEQYARRVRDGRHDR